MNILKRISVDLKYSGILAYFRKIFQSLFNYPSNLLHNLVDASGDSG